VVLSAPVGRTDRPRDIWWGLSLTRELQPDDPQTIGPYRLVGQLGQGGMGRVFLGVSPGGRPVAAKAIRAELAADPGVPGPVRPGGRGGAAGERGVHRPDGGRGRDGPVVARGCLGWPVHPPAKDNLYTPDRQMAANSAEGI